MPEESYWRHYTEDNPHNRLLSYAAAHYLNTEHSDHAPHARQLFIEAAHRHADAHGVKRREFRTESDVRRHAERWAFHAPSGGVHAPLSPDHPQRVGYRGFAGQSAGGLGFGATEGHGVYIAHSKAGARWFGSVKRVTYPEPRNPLHVRDEELPLLSESDTLLEKPKRGDSTWIRLNKEAARHAGASDQNWHPEHIAHHLTRLLHEAGHDAVRVHHGGDSWDVLLHPRLQNAVRYGGRK